MRAVTTGTAALSLGIHKKDLDNILSRYNVPGFERGRQGVARRLSQASIEQVALAIDLTRDFSIPTPTALLLAEEALSSREGVITSPGGLLAIHADLEAEVAHDSLTVVSWILPATDATRREQAGQSRYPSERWARTRHYGELFNVALRRHLVAELAQRGIPSVAPLLSQAWHRSDEGPYAPCSTWSERHAAHTAGLGTFGLCDGLITPVGKAHRTGSVIAGVKLPPSARPYRDHRAYCLHFTHGTCGKCIPRCPVKALSAQGHDKRRCQEYTERAMNRHLKEAYGIDNYACGLCQAGVPCTGHVPAPEEG